MQAMQMHLKFAATIALLLAAFPAATQTLEDVRHEADLRACNQIADERQRGDCVARVQAQIRAERIRRIEEQARRRQSN